MSQTLIRINGEEVLLDEEGFLIHPESWSEAVAESFALEDGLPQLQEVHWRIINILREYYLANGRAPLNSELKKATGMTISQIEASFPKGIRRGARRLAGLPNPKSCG
ncbi:TusE/DsrC/DsvC family sulfur relay protein [Desulfomonile tiedjei]|uniref:Sulfur relay protein, TusE/DsrC/DsvC family n=1 Tax=Desulfomonile tiedjei (strain ATCC 49306 / DSM 6799 / DCB-1) TaxID=706587 RepID=I4C1K4_DESTA|nr:TusE/DsrC/DsvC family sulfur relay protein [Desulfomonile tiedjei]AFM23445.1 sulfur relay protein, TusE/DsrC/DsvC family [Desulfomonile tiedjei DSM 6799]